MGYLLDDREISNGFTRSSLWTEELWIETRSYVYHPALLDMKIGGGPVLLRDTYSTQSGSNTEDETLFNFDARLDFLARKRYPFGVFASRDHSEMTTNLLGRFLASTDTYGASGSIRRGKMPLSAQWNLSHVESAGSGFGSTVDESIDQAALGASLSYFERHSLSLNLDWSERESRSGSAALPIQESLIETFGANLIGTNTFGKRSRVSLRQDLRLLQQDTATFSATEVERLSYHANLNWDTSERLQTNATFTFRDEDRNSNRSRNRDGRLAITLQATERLSVVGSGTASRNENPGFTLDRSGAGITTIYRRSFALGELSLSGALAFTRTDQVATIDIVSVFDEPHRLVGIETVFLASDFILTNTVVVTNVAQTQTFIEGVDYRLVTIGSRTSIERLVTGNILDGEDVLVSYEFQAGGTAEYDTGSESVGLSFAFNKYANVYVRLFNSENDLRSGISTVPFNDRRGVEAGAGVEVPLVAGWSVGGQVRYRTQSEDISPADSAYYDLHVNTGTFWRTRAQFGVLQEEVDNKLSDEDVDLQRYYAKVLCRLPGASQLTYSYISGRDDGGSIIREDTAQNLQFDWRYRQVVFSLRARKTNLQQGATQRSDTRVSAEIRRRF